MSQNDGSAASAAPPIDPPAKVAVEADSLVEPALLFDDDEPLLEPTLVDPMTGEPILDFDDPDEDTR